MVKKRGVRGKDSQEDVQDEDEMRKETEAFKVDQEDVKYDLT